MDIRQSPLCYRACWAHILDCSVYTAIPRGIEQPMQRFGHPLRFPGFFFDGPNFEIRHDMTCHITCYMIRRVKSDSVKSRRLSEGQISANTNVKTKYETHLTGWVINFIRVWRTGIYLWFYQFRPDKLQQTNDCTQCVPCWLRIFIF